MRTDARMRIPSRTCGAMSPFVPPKTLAKAMRDPSTPKRTSSHFPVM